MEKAATTPSDQVANRPPGNGRQILVGIVSSYKKVWQECGQVEFEKQLAESFKKDAVKTVQAMAFLLPKTHPEDNQQPIPVAAYKSIT